MKSNSHNSKPASIGQRKKSVYTIRVPELNAKTRKRVDSYFANLHRRLKSQSG